MSVYYVQLLYVHIMLQKCQEHVKTIFIKDRKQNKKIYEDENTSFYFIRTKIKICIFIRTKNLFNPVFYSGVRGLCVNISLKIIILKC